MVKFNVKLSNSTYRVVGALARWTDGTMADVIREALSIFWWLAREYRQGHRLMIRRGDQLTELLIPSLERLTAVDLEADDARPEASPRADDSCTTPRTGEDSQATAGG